MAIRIRRRWIVLLLLLGLALAGFFTLRFLLQPDRVSALLLQKIEDATGLEVSLQKPADIGLWPDLHVELIGLDVRAPDAERGFLHVDLVELALPWSALRNGENIHLRRLRLVKPDLDIPALNEFFAGRMESGPPAPLQIPSLDAPLEIRDGRIRGDGWRLEKLLLNLPFLSAGMPTQLDAGGMLALDAKQHRFALQLTTTPISDGGALRLEPLILDLVIDGLSSWRPHIEGHVLWYPSGIVELDLQSQIASWDSAWPALPLPPADDPAPVQLKLHYKGATSLQDTANFAAMRGEDGLRGRVKLNDTLEWLGSQHVSPLPPLDGEIEIPRLHYEGIEATGVRLRMQPGDTKP